MTQAEWLAYEARRTSGNPQADSMSKSAERESKLHEQILDYCRQRGWYVVHSRMDRPTTNQVGCPDFIIVTSSRFELHQRGDGGGFSRLESGAVHFIEAKTRDGKLTEAQRNAKAWLEKLGRQYHVVRSLDEFVKVVS